MNPKTNNKKKILFYTDTPLYGGAEHQMYLLVKLLDRQKFEPIVAVRNQEPLQHWIEKFQQLEVKTYLINSKTKNSLSNYFELKRIIRLEQPDLIHAHIWNPMACKYLFLAAPGIPLVTTEHDPFQLNPVKKFYKKWSLRRTARVITVSEANRQLMQELYPASAQKIVTVHNGIEPVKSVSEQKVQKIRKEIFHTGANNIVLFCVGTLHPRKGFKYVISAFKKIALKYPLAKLIIAGEGPEREALKKLIKNLELEKKVLLFGYRPDITELMQASQIFILPSLKEAFGLVILEAWASGLAVIASQVGGIPEIITAESGLLVPPANKNELVKAISKLIKSPELVQKLAKGGQSRLKLFSAEKTARETELVYQSVLEQSP